MILYELSVDVLKPVAFPPPVNNSDVLLLMEFRLIVNVPEELTVTEPAVESKSQPVPATCPALALKI